MSHNAVVQVLVLLRIWQFSLSTFGRIYLCFWMPVRARRPV